MSERESERKRINTVVGLSQNLYFSVCGLFITAPGRPFRFVLTRSHSFSLILTHSHSFSLVLCRSLQVLSAVRHDDTGVFKGLPQDFDVVRYHSLVIDGGSLPDSLRVTAWVEEDEDEKDEEDEGEEEDKGGGRKTGKEGGDDGGGDGRIIMGVAHVSKPLWGVQFHPESISTQFGTALLRRFREGMV